MPRSMRKPRIWLMMAVRWRTRRERTRWSESRLHVLGWDQASLVPEGLDLARNVMRA